MKRVKLCVAYLAIAVMASSSANATNYVEVLTSRSNVPGNPTQAFVMEVEVVLEDLDPANVDGVGIEVDNGLTTLTLETDFDVTRWQAEVEYTSLAAMKTGLDGTWTITITGTSASTSTFAFTASTLQDADYYPVPTGLVPDDGATDVALDVTLMWNDPTGAATPYIVGVEVGSNSNSGEQEALSAPFGPLAITDTSWTPPLTLLPGENFLFVFYVDVDSSLVTPLQVTSGSIPWGNSGFAPAGPPFGPWPATTPLLVLESFSEFTFTTERLVEDFEAYALQSDSSGPDEFLVTTTGNLADPVVAAVSEGLAESTGIALDASNQVWALGSSAGSTQGFLLIGDIPSFSASSAGPFAEFFAGPRSLSNTTIRAAVRETTNATPTEARFVLGDALDNETFSSRVPVTTSFQMLEASSFDFESDPPDSFDFEQVTLIGIEFFAAAGSVPQLQFQVDDVEITTAPEPGALLLQLSATVTLAAWTWRRRRPG